MKRSKLWAGAVLVTLVLFTFSVQAQGVVSLEDQTGEEVEIETPVERIVCLNPALNEILAILGAEDRIVGINEGTEFPPVFEGILEVGGSSRNPQVEKIIELKPDVIIADTMLDEEVRKQFESFGIPVVVERASELNRLPKVIENLGKIVDNEDRAEELNSFIGEYNKLIEDRLSSLEKEDRTDVYWEWRGAYRSGNEDSNIHPRLELTEANNIAAHLEAPYPQVSAEFVWERDPEVIIRMASRSDSKEDMAQTREEIVNRQGLKEVEAVKNERVYLISWDVMNGPRSVVGSLYFANWFYPEKFVDIEPEEVYQEMLAEFYNYEGETAPVVFPGE